MKDRLILTAMVLVSMLVIVVTVGYSLPIGQAGQDTTYIPFIALGPIEPSHTLVFHDSESKKKFWIDFGGDTLKSGGDMVLDSATALFMEHLIEGYSGRIRELKDTIAELKRREILRR